VAREFKTAQHLGAGDTFVVKSEGKEYPFEIVGVVTSPGLEVVSKFFSVGEDFTEQAIHAVFGSRKDLKEKLGTDAISMIQIGLVEGHLRRGGGCRDPLDAHGRGPARRGKRAENQAGDRGALSGGRLLVSTLVCALRDDHLVLWRGEQSSSPGSRRASSSSAC